MRKGGEERSGWKHLRTWPLDKTSRFFSWHTDEYALYTDFCFLNLATEEGIRSISSSRVGPHVAADAEAEEEGEEWKEITDGAPPAAADTGKASVSILMCPLAELTELMKGGELSMKLVALAVGYFSDDLLSTTEEEEEEKEEADDLVALADSLLSDSGATKSMTPKNLGTNGRSGEKASLRFE